MKVCICGSMSVIDEMEALATRLRSDGHDVVTPDLSEIDDRWDELTLPQQVQAKQGFIDDYLEKIRHADAVVIANFANKGIPGYVGANTLIEAAFAKALSIPVHLVEEPGEQPCQVEILALQTPTLRTPTDEANPLKLA